MRLLASLLLSLGVVSPATAVTMDWTPIANPGNACEVQSGPGFFAGCFGAVGYTYNIGTYEVTNAQYAEFLNAKAASDPFALYSPQMGGTGFRDRGGITRSGISGSYTYSAIAGREDMPVNYVSFFDAARFANWMNNGQGDGDTESGSYTLLGGTYIPSNGQTVTRNADAMIVLPTEDEWYKAAYYDASSASYFDYPASSNASTTCPAPGPTANSANCYYAVNFPYGDETPVGSYPNSASHGTFDQGGNVAEWNETIFADTLHRGMRGGDYVNLPDLLAASSRNQVYPAQEGSISGFRLAMIPEPGTGLLVITGLLGLAGWRRSQPPVRAAIGNGASAGA